MHTSLSLNPQYEELTTSLHQIDALLEIATHTDFANVESETMLNYFLVITDLLYKAKKNCGDLATIKVCLPIEKQELVT